MTQPHKVCPHCKKEVFWAGHVTDTKQEGTLLHYKVCCPECKKEFELFMDND